MTIRAPLIVVERIRDPADSSMHVRRRNRFRGEQDEPSSPVSLEADRQAKPLIPPLFAGYVTVPIHNSEGAT